MAENKKSEYDRIKATPVLEFWAVFDLWKARKKAEIEAARSRNRNGKP